MKLQWHRKWIRTISAFALRKRWKPIISSTEELAGLLKKALAFSGQPSVACAIVRSEGLPLIAAAGTTMVDNGSEVHSKSLYHIGSTQKSMTALLMARLVEQNKIAYSSTLAEVFPDVSMRSEYANRTLLDLTLSRAGLIPFQRYDLEDPVIASEFWDRIPSRFSDSPRSQRKAITTAALALPSVPGPVYSNVSWAVLGHALEVRAGMDYEQALETQVLSPLGITGHKFGGWPDDRYDPREPVGHYPGTKDEKCRTQTDSDRYRFPDWMQPAGGLNLNIEGFANYAREHLRGLQGKGDLLSRNAYKELHRIHHSVDSGIMYPGTPAGFKQNFGLGWGIAKTALGPLSLSDGSGGTFYARLMVFPTLDIAFAGLSNHGSGQIVFGRVLEAATGLSWD
jgi:D-alanyl-D-alanine carboxypeptidase